MHLWIVFLSLVWTPTESFAAPGVERTGPMRYRGIEQLLAKFDAQADATPG